MKHVHPECKDGHGHHQAMPRFPAGSRLLAAITANTIFLLCEALFGFFAHSLALLGDAAHNFSDSFALVLSLIAVHMAARPATERRTFGYHRLGILAAFVNSLGIALICFYLVYESLRRLSSPAEVRGLAMMVEAGLGFLVNGGTAMLLRRGRSDLNLRSAFLHLFTDALVSLGVVISGGIILLTGWNFVDPLVTMFIGLLILVSAFDILRESAHILMESVPQGVDYRGVVEDILDMPSVLGVHDLHIWEIGSRQYSLSAHVVVADIPVSEAQALAVDIKTMLLNAHRVIHATLEMESEPCAENGVCRLEEAQEASRRRETAWKEREEGVGD